MTDGPNTLRFSYDGAERLTKVEESLGFGLWRPLRTFTYATANLGFNRRLGKLWEARAYNHLMIGSTAYTAEITETYGYAGKQGRVSVRDTAAQVTAPFIGIPASFTQSWTWNDLGDVASVTYPVCTHAGCTATAIRTVTPAYTNGFLTSVPGYTSPSAPNGRPITYHPNGQVNQVFRANDTTDTYTKDPQNQPRPRKIETRVASSGTIRWSSALLSYDGAGNLSRAGNAYYLYDPVSRVKDGLLYLSPGGGGATATFDHAYDGFGNLQSLTTNTATRNTPTSISTNRLLGTAGYDAAGNLISWGGATYKYDALGQMWGMTNGTEDWLYLYTADGERLWSYEPTAGRSRWTVRDLDGKVLREYKDDAAGWSIERDYVYRGSQLLAAHTADPAPNDLIHLHPDHLGTPRAITNQNSIRTDYHIYFPYGEEASSPTQDVERMKFTGHERDLGDPSSPADDLDYMHARFYNPQAGRFLSVDPARSASATLPQSWNRYSYAVSNPLRNVDLDGRAWQPAYGENQDVRKALRETLRNVPVIGGPLAAAADFLIADFFPVNPSEARASVDSAILSFGTVLNPGSKAAALGRKLDNIFTDNLDTATIQAAAREKAGQVVARKASGEPFNHITKFEDAHDGAKKAVASLQRMVGDARLSDSEHAYAQYLLSKYSKKLDEAEALLERELKEAKQ